MRTDILTTWIDVQKKMPIENKKLLISLTDGFVTTGYLIKDKWITFRIDGYTVEKFDKVTAWMPLPDSYRRQTNG